MKLYELERESLFTLANNKEHVYKLVKIDGAYSICLDKEQGVVHFHVGTPVSLIWCGSSKQT